MSALKPKWVVRNTSGLEASAKRRAEATRRRVDDAIAALLRVSSQRINLNTVAAAAGVTTAYLNKQPGLRDRVDRLRQQQFDTGRRLASLRERSKESSRVLMLAKERRIRELETRVRQLQSELATCRGQVCDALRPCDNGARSGGQANTG
jgi:hypothetical protein